MRHPAIHGLLALTGLTAAVIVLGVDFTAWYRVLAARALSVTSLGDVLSFVFGPYIPSERVSLIRSLRGLMQGLPVSLVLLGLAAVEWRTFRYGSAHV